MKSELIFIVQECICIDFLINAVITSNIYSNFKFFDNLKKENLKNIKILCNIYKRTYNNELLIKNTPSISLDKNTENNLDVLLKYSLNILTRLNLLKKQYSNTYYNKLFKGLYKSYFDLISYIHCFYPLSYNTSLDLKYENNNTFFNILNSSTLDIYDKTNRFELIRNICIEAIYIFFDYDLTEKLIRDEYYEIFFENNPENKFYQFFFKSNNISFKVRIYDKSLIVFYIYQYNESELNISPPLNKVSSKLAIDIYLKEKFKGEFNNLIFDENYINSSYYEDNIEYYKFKYNYNNRNIKECLYVSINVNSSIIQELYLI